MLIQVVALAIAAAVVVSCSRPWPAEPPDAHEWQLMVAPANLVPEQAAGTAIAAFAFAQERPSPPACDGVGDDDCEDYVSRYGRQLPARLTVACWDHDSDGEGCAGHHVHAVTSAARRSGPPSTPLVRMGA